MSKKLTMVIPVHNAWRYTASCIASILKSSYPKENYDIIVVDNASTDYTPTLLSYLIEQGEPLKVIRNAENLDYVGGTNQAWKTVETPYVSLMNNDIVLHKDCLRLQMQTFNKDPAIGVVGAVQYFPNGDREPPIMHFHRDEKVGNLHQTEIINENVDYIGVDCVLFSNVMIKKEVWEKVGFYDEQFHPSMYEEEDYVLRVKEVGFKMVLVPKATFVHHVAISTRRDYDYYQAVLTRNKQRFIKKWGKKLMEAKV